MTLTRREAEIVGYCADGLTHKEIAEAMGISVGTVKVYCSRLATKLGLGPGAGGHAIAIRELKRRIRALEEDLAFFRSALWPAAL